MSDERDDSTTRAGEHHGPPSVGPVWSRRILVAFAVGCVLLFFSDFILHRHLYHPWEEIPGFYGIYGFVGVAGLIVVSKELRKLVARSEDYYDAE